MGAIAAGVRRSGGTLEVRAGDPTKPFGDSTPPAPGMGGGSVAGTSINATTAQAISAVATSVSIISDAISTLPVKEYVLKGKQLVEVDRSPVIARPWSELPGMLDFVDQSTRSMAMRGNAYGRIVQRDAMGFPLQVVLTNPDRVQDTRDRMTGQRIVRFGRDVIDLDDLFHIPYQMGPGEVVGLNPIELHRNTLGIARASDLMAATFFANSARPDGIIKVNGDLTPDDLEQMARTWLSVHQGIGNSSLPAIMTGDVDWQQLSVSPKDAQFLETRQYSSSQIYSIFRIPPHMAGDVDRTTSWGTGIEQQEIGFVRNTLSGYICRQETALSALVRRGHFVRFDLSERLRGDSLQRWQQYSIARAIGGLTINEIRANENRPMSDDEWADDLMAPLNSAQNGSIANPDEADPNDPTKTAKP